ncbi:dna polymerase iii subunits gamma and tau [Lasius niger]|uniref:DNA-directed DNA polymerase n=1 Tax=Lasius niger TaxID=67767 RepID=A0A0J7KMT4_LASNI|nr:dna polymerase iii subunits gamma and tau [Lasius niger]
MDEDELPIPPTEDSFSLLLDEDESPKSDKNLTDQPLEKEQAVPYQVLARKYRPRDFDDLIGQETMVRILRRSFELNRVAHGFMLTGVRGVGKTTTARIIARALNCIGPDGKGGPTPDPCGVCPECQAILADRHPDVLELDAASRTGVDDMREIIESTRFRPMQGRMKVFVIDEVHMLSRAAFNALLKTLEEPPPQVTFVFATTELRKVPVTVLSRCQKFNLRRVPETLMATHLTAIAEKENISFSADAITLLARAAEGSVRDGLSLLDQAIAQGASDAKQMEEMLGLTGQTQLYELLEHILQGDMAAILDLSAKLYALGVEARALIADLMEAIHQISRMKAIPSLIEGSEFSQIEKERGSILAAQLSDAALGRAWQILRQGLEEVEGAPDRYQALEMILIRLTYASSLPTPDRLIRLFQNKIEASPDKAPLPIGGEGAGKKTQPKLEKTSPPALGQTQKESLLPQDWKGLLEAIREKDDDIWLRTMLSCAGRLVEYSAPYLCLQIDASDSNIRQRLEDGLRRVLRQLWPEEKWELCFVLAGGGATLDEQKAEAEERTLEEVAKDPLVARCLKEWPGSKLKKFIPPETDEVLEE